ncbi:MAG: ATP-binding protein [Nitrospiraceae bacterium]|nr:ATP-binding protein [Nitrospiraceae bacterium]
MFRQGNRSPWRKGEGARGLKGLNQKLLSLAIAVSLSLTLLIIYYEYLEDRRIVEEIYREDLTAHVLFVNELIETRMVERDIPRLNEDLRMMMHHGWLKGLTIFDSHGSPRFSFGSRSPLSCLSLSPAVCSGCHSARYSNIASFSHELRNGPRCRSCHNGDPIGVVSLIAENKPIHAVHMKTKVGIFSTFFGIVLVFATIGRTYLNTHVVKRLRRISDAVGMVKEGRSVQILDGKGDEIAEIAEAVSRMSEDLVLARKTLQNSRLHLENILNNIQDYVVVIDREYRITYANRKALEHFAREEHEVVGSKCHELIHHADRPCDETRAGDEQFCGLREAFLGRSVQFVHRLETGQGIRYMSKQYSPFYEEGSIPYVIELVRDVTALKEMEAEKEKLHGQLLHSQKVEAIGTFVGGIAHDFNNILTAVLGHADLALLKNIGNEGLGKNLDSIRCAGERGRELTHQLLLFGRKAPTDRRVWDLNVIVGDSMRFIERLLSEDIAVACLQSAGPLYVRADRGQLTQVLLNLCVNARDAMTDGGSLIIRTGRAARSGIGEGGCVTLEVSDTGRGIPPDIIANIFEPFFTTKPEGRGTGLGLSVVQSVVEIHQGEVQVRSTSEDGTRFTVFLPEVSGHLAHQPSEPAEGELPGGKEHILLVDDDETVLNTGRAILLELGYRVTAAHSGGEALAKFSACRGNFDLVLSDLVMPDMKGSDMYFRMSSHKPGLKFMLITGYGRHIAAKAQNAGISGIIEKPLRVSDLAHRVRRVLDGGTLPA